MDSVFGSFWTAAVGLAVPWTFGSWAVTLPWSNTTDKIPITHTNAILFIIAPPYVSFSYPPTKVIHNPPTRWYIFLKYNIIIGKLQLETWGRAISRRSQILLSSTCSTYTGQRLPERRYHIQRFA